MLYAGGYDGSAAVTTVEFMTVSTTGNANIFGDLGTANTHQNAGGGNKNRFLYSGGSDGGRSTIIGYVEYSTLGTTKDFGDLTVGRDGLAAASNNTRFLSLGGYAGSGGGEDEIDYVTIASLGNSADFGNLSDERMYLAGVNSNTRAIVGGGKKDRFLYSGG